MGTQRVPRVRRSAAEIAEILSALRSSGVTRRVFCAERGLSVNTINNWIGRRRDSRTPSSSRRRIRQPRLIPVTITAGSPSKGDRGSPFCEIILKNNRSLRILSTRDPDQIRVLLGAIEAL